MKRILLLSEELTLRGSSLYTVTLARELKLRGHKVAVLGPGGLFDNSLEKHRIPIITAPVHSALPRNLLYFGRYCEAVRQFEPDVLHIQHHNQAALGAMVAQYTKIPAVLTVHGQIEQRLRFPLARPPRIIAVSEAVRQSLVTSGQVDREGIEVIPNGVSASLSALEDEAEPDAPRGVPIVGTVNRIAPGRGIDVMLRACRRVLDEGLEARFLVIGEGPGERDARRLARDLDLTKHLTIAVPRARMADLFKPMDLFVSASQSGGHGILLLAAMAQARPVIATAVGGVVSYLRDRENGLVVQRGDVSALAAGICELLRDPELARSMAHAGFRVVRERFPVAAMVEKTVAFYDS